MNTGTIWGVFFVVTTGTSTLLSGLLAVFAGDYWWLLGGLFYLVVVLATFILGWTIIPQNNEAIAEMLGQYIGEEWKAGLHFRLPFFMQIKALVFKGEQAMKLYLDEEARQDYGFGKIDFTDGSAPVVAFCYFQIIDSYKAVYAISDLIKGIEQKIDNAIRTYLAQYSIDNALKWKPQFDLQRILNGDKPDSSGNWPTKTLLESISTYTEILNTWGTEIKSIIISDIVLSDSIIEIRNKVLLAEKEAQAAVKLKEASITKAEGERQVSILLAEAKKQGLVLEGEGLEMLIDSIATKLTGSEAAKLIVELRKWSSIGENKNSVIIDSGNSTAGLGAALGAGYNKAGAGGGK